MGGCGLSGMPTRPRARTVDGKTTLKKPGPQLEPWMENHVKKPQPGDRAHLYVARGVASLRGLRAAGGLRIPFLQVPGVLAKVVG